MLLLFPLVLQLYLQVLWHLLFLFRSLRLLLLLPQCCYSLMRAVYTDPQNSICSLQN